MNALVKKEIRLILPAWVLAMALAIFPVWLLWPGSSFTPVYGWNVQAPGALVYGPFALGVLLLGLASFGHEFNYGTFSILLAQPISRRRLWATKTMTVGLALLIVFVALCISDCIRVVTVVGHLKVSDWQRALDQVGTRKLVLGIIQGIYNANLYGTLVYGGLSVLAAFAGGLWTNLLFRNTSAAFWLSMLIPAGLWMLAQGVFGPVGLVAQTALIGTLVLYSAAGFFWAKRHFLRVQDVQWTGGIISFPTWSSSSATADGTIERRHKPLRALFRKEIQFQQANLFISFLLLLTHLFDLVVRKFGASYFLLHQQARMIWESWPLLWLAMPFLIGAVAVAEERKLGTLETLLCLPTKRRREFVVKFTTAVALGIFLGGVMPVLAEWLGALIGVKSNAGTLMVNWTMISQAGALLLGSAALVMLAFYASTLTRNLLAALGLTVVWSIAAFFLTELVTIIGRMGYDRVALWGGKLPLLTIFPVMLAAVTWLSFVNFKRLQTSSRLWIRNVFVLVVSLLGSAVVTTAIFNRVWEVWIPDEPAHSGMVFLPIARTPSGFPNQFVMPKIDSSLAGTAVVLPDGRLWLRRCQVDRIEHKTSDGRQYWELHEAGSWQSSFVAGTNWLDVAVTPYQCYAIQKDGSLWDLSAVVPGDQNAVAPIRVRNDSDWETITAGASCFTALKSDGTLWQWGKLPKADGGDVSTEAVSAPRQLGTDRDWVAVNDCGTSQGGVAVKEDGSVWRYGYVANVGSDRFVSAAGPERWLSGPRGKPKSVSFNGSYLLLVSREGSLWGWGGGYGLAPNSGSEMICLDRSLNWIDAQFAQWPYAIGMKRDHSLWMATSRWGQMGLYWEMISRHNDWIAISPEASNKPGSVAPPNDHFLALASDGILCQWNGRILDPYQRWHYWGEGRLLMPSRIKAKVIAELKR